MTDERNGPNGADKPADEETGPYRILEEEGAEPASAPARAGPVRTDAAAAETRRDNADRDGGAGIEGDEREQEVDEGEGEGGEEEGSEADSLAPAISRPAAPMPWLVAAGTAFALLAISWLAGAPQLALPDPEGGFPELSLGQRLGGLARTVVFLPLATAAALLGVGALAFVRQRPLGDTVALAAKCAAIVALSALVWLIPIEIRFVKQTLHLAGVPLLAALLAIPVLRLHPRDAALATGATLVVFSLLVIGAHVVVWATGTV